MRNRLCAALTWISILVVVSSAAAQPDAARPTIHRVTVDTQSGVLTITGAGLGQHLVVTVEGAPVPLLPGATDTQVDIAPPPELLNTPGTYRLTVLDPVRRMGDAFVVASEAASVGLGNAASNATPNAASGANPVRLGPRVVGAASTAVLPSAGGPAPMTVIEDSGSPYRTAIGYQALFSNTGSGLANTASGYQALYFNTTGYQNTANGIGALRSNTTGPDNTASGAWVLSSNTTGSNNTATGSFALTLNDTGFHNTASGVSALYNNTVGSSNTASGMEALVYNTSGFFNTASGTQALYSNTTGAVNTATGVSALYSNITGDSNTATGAGALFANTSGANNAALGYNAGHDATTGSFNLFLGAYVAGTAADTNTIRIGLPYGGGIGQNRTFVAGIYGTQLAGGAQVVYIDANGQLGTAAIGGGGGGFLPMSELQQQVRAQQQRLRDQEAVNADLRARLARLEALLLSAGRK